ncbi:unnamed protein product [Acanthoscelides obtectus]|uniref:Uncharacterized protein n=1 Tax=Acanthoscelides obtectus TaxID=200917 RepID=A0A9P0MGT6_ACAOB|nr:unnamed protein product [Acanthoscelides obtectus]CAK1649557.1 hypothetical protein AOBTE_LOCUS16308 [Acanthoscelides obtectus]
MPKKSVCYGLMKYHAKGFSMYKKCVTTKRNDTKTVIRNIDLLSCAEKVLCLLCLCVTLA